jgi:exonuclease SbcC
MHLEELEIVNFCQHRRQHHRFAPGLTAIIGANGSGKSNMMGAVTFALTGGNPNVGEKADNICQLAPPEEKSFVCLVFSHGTERVHVTRHLRPAGTKTKIRVYHINDSPGYVPPAFEGEGDTVANRKIAEILGASFDIIGDMVLVPQEEIFGFLDLLPAKRAASFQRLFRTEHSKDIYEAVNRFLNTVAVPPEPPLEQYHQELEKAQTGKQQWEQYVAGLRTADVITAERDLEIKLIGNYEARRNTNTAIASDTDRMQALREPLIACQKRIEQYLANKEALTRDISGSVAAFETAKAALINLANYRKVEESRAYIRQQRNRDQVKLDAMNDCPPPKPADYLNRATRDAQLTAAQAAVTECRTGLLASTTKGLVEVRCSAVEADLKAMVLPTPPTDYEPQGERDHAVIRAENSVKVSRQFIDTFADGKQVCPTCGTLTSTLQDRLESEKAGLPALEQELATAIRRQQASDAYDADLERYRTNKRELEGQLAYWKDQLSKWEQLAPFQAEFERLKGVADKSAFYDAAMQTYENERGRLRQAIAQWDQQEASLHALEQPQVPEAELQRLVNDHAERQKAADECDRLLQGDRQEESRLQGQLAQLEATIANRVASRVAIADVPEERYQAALQNQQRLEEELRTRHQTDQNLSLAVQNFAYWSNAVRQGRETLRQSQTIIAAREQLLKVRDLFHHSNLPRFVAHQNLNRLQAAINRFLEMFQTDFRVRADEGLSFIAEFLDHRRQAAERLSGGQKVILALAFRLAVNVMFAENIGLLALDEPTAFVDEHHIRGFEPVLQQLRAFSTSRGLQCVMITHERGLAPLFDAVISL